MFIVEVLKVKWPHKRIRFVLELYGPFLHTTNLTRSYCLTGNRNHERTSNSDQHHYFTSWELNARSFENKARDLTTVQPREYTKKEKFECALKILNVIFVFYLKHKRITTIV